MEYPLAERELRRLAARPTTFATRAALGVVAVPVLSFFLLADLSSGGVAAQADSISAALGFVGSFYLFVVSVLVPPFLTAGLIASEKHERTLGTLLIADFNAADVTLSKFVPTLIQIELLIVGSLPILAFVTVLGGLTPSDLVLSVFLFGVTGLLVSSLGLLASTLARQPGGALMATVVVLAPVLALDAGAGTLLNVPALEALPPLMPSTTAFGIDESTTINAWLPTVAGALAASLLFVLAAILLLPRQVYANKVRTPRRLRAWRRPVNPFLRERGTALIFSRAAGGLSAAARSIVLRVVFGAALALIALIPCLGAVFVAGVVMFDVVSTMDNAKRSGVLDDIRLSAPEPRTFLWDIYYALWMRGWYYLPAIALGGSMQFGGWVADLAARSTLEPHSPLGIIAAVAAIVVAVLLAAVAQLALMTAIGCYQSGYGRNIRSQTLTSVVLYTVVTLATGLGLAILAAIISALEMGPAATITQGVVLTAAFTGAVALWAGGFYMSYRVRHLEYV